MILTQITTIPPAHLPVAAFKDHLRLGSGFSDDSLQDGVLQTYLRAAIAAIEGRTGVIIPRRDFLWSLTRWDEHGDSLGGGGRRQCLPVTPVNRLVSVQLIDADDMAQAVDLTDFALQKDGSRGLIVAVSGALPNVPEFGLIQITFNAGYSGDFGDSADDADTAWGAVPSDLYQAVLMLAAYFYENRGGEGGESPAFPPAVLALIERYRVLRISATRPANQRRDG